MMRTTKCVTDYKRKVLRFIFAFFSIFPFFLSLTLILLSKISQELLDLGFLKFVHTSDMTGCTVYKRIRHILLIIPFTIFVHFSFFPINTTVMASDGYHRGYVNFAHCFLYSTTATLATLITATAASLTTTTTFYNRNPASLITVTALTLKTATAFTTATASTIITATAAYFNCNCSTIDNCKLQLR